MLQPRRAPLRCRSWHASLDHPAGDHGRLDNNDDRLRPGATRCVRPPLLLRRRRRADEGQPFGPDPRAHWEMAPCSPGCRAIDRLCSTPCRDCIPLIKVNGIVSSGYGCSHLQAALSAAPEFASRLPAKSRPPTTAWATSGSEPRNLLEELTNNAKLTAQSFRGRARRRLARRPNRSRLVGAPRSVPEPGPIPAQGLALPPTWMKQESNGRTGTTRRPRSSGASMKQPEAPGGASPGNEGRA